MPSVLELVKELAAYEKAPDEVTNTLEDMEKDGFGLQPAYGLFVACIEDRIIGMAIYYIKYSTWKGKGVYLEDIVVRESERKQGCGRKLFEAVISKAKQLEARQLHWQVLDWNQPAIDFYKKYKPFFDQEWINCKMNEIQLKNYTDESF